MNLRIAIVADGPPTEKFTNSGVARGITVALSMRDDIRVVSASSTRPSGSARLLLALMTFRLSRRKWWEQFNFGRLGLRLRSASRDRVAGTEDTTDCILQVRNLYRPARLPYFVFIDATYAMSLSNWSGWSFGRKLTRQRLAAERLQFAEAQHVFTAGESARLSVIDDYHVPSNRVTAVGGGINLVPLPTESEVLRFTSERAATANILFVGTDWERKGGDVLLSAFRAVKRAVPHATLTIVGPDVAIPPENGVRSLGRIRDDAVMRALYEEASVFCLPARFEPYGLVIPEALSYGLPIVSTNIGAIPDMVDDGIEGRLVRPDDAEELAAALSAVLVNADGRRNMGLAAYDRSLTMSWDAVAASIAEVMKRTLAK